MTAAAGAPVSHGYCPVCGAEVKWLPTSHLWPSRRVAREVLPSQSGTCPRCHRILMYTVLNESAADVSSEEH